LRTVLIVLGVAAIGAIIYSTTGSPGPAFTPSPTTTPTPTCGTCFGVAGRNRH
jgi:hypothetical protein